jgi:hypothetical protein
VLDEVSTAIPGGGAAGNKLLAGRILQLIRPVVLLAIKSKIHAMLFYLHGAKMFKNPMDF